MGSLGVEFLVLFLFFLRCLGRMRKMDGVFSVPVYEDVQETRTAIRLALAKERDGLVVVPQALADLGVRGRHRHLLCELSML